MRLDGAPLPPVPHLHLVLDETGDQLLERFRPMAPEGFERELAVELEGTIGAVELRYRHADGRGHVLRVSLLSGRVFESRTEALHTTKRRSTCL